MYAATGLTFGERHPDDGEFVSTVELDIDDAIDLIMSGEITDAKTQTAVLKFLQLQKNAGGHR